MSKRYSIGWYSYKESGKIILKNEIRSFVVLDKHSKDQIVAEFPVKVSKIENGNPNFYGVNINDERMAIKMARLVCDQMNRESGY